MFLGWLAAGDGCSSSQGPAELGRYRLAGHDGGHHLADGLRIWRSEEAAHREVDELRGELAWLE